MIEPSDEKLNEVISMFGNELKLDQRDIYEIGSIEDESIDPLLWTLVKNSGLYDDQNPVSILPILSILQQRKNPDLEKYLEKNISIWNNKHEKGELSTADYDWLMRFYVNFQQKP